MKSGLYYKNNKLIYYENDKPKHAGVIKVDGAIYYISSKGRAVRGEKTVHRYRANGILERGFYTFGEDYKLVEGSYRPIKKQKGYRIRAAVHKLKKNKQVKKFLNKKYILPAIAVCLSTFFLVMLLQSANGEAEKFSNDSAAESNTALESNGVVLPVFEEEVLLCSPAAKKLYDGEYDVELAIDAGDPYKPLVFEYHLEKNSGTLLISEDPSFRAFREFALAKENDSITIDNLKTGSTYYYRVLVDGAVYEDTFKTAASTRFVSMSGLRNTRDIGGYQTMDGRTVRQGLLIRGMELDGLAQPTYFVPREDIEEVQETFGFVYDFDLRSASLFAGAEYQSRLKDQARHKFYSAPAYGEIFHVVGIENVRKIFQDLAKPENYPMYFHCTYGADRTGTAVFLLQGLLGMSEEDMIREYQMTGFFDRTFADSQKIEVVIEGMNSYAGDTLQEKIESYFVEGVGLTEAEIESIRSIFLE